MTNSILCYQAAHEWTVNDVKNWLQEIDFKGYQNLFEKHKIDGKVLLILSEEDLRKPPLQLNLLGDIKNLYLSINKLQTINNNYFSKLPYNHFGSKYFFLKEQIKTELRNTNNVNIFKKPNTKNRNSSDKVSDYSSNIDLSGDDFEDDLNHILKVPNKRYQELKPEAWKAFIALIYFFAVTWITAIVMVIVHDRVPDMQTYPPLPDIVLDNVPYISWAFVMCELCGLILFIILFLLLIFHKFRFIILRRLFSLSGTVFLLRCVTMLITSLSVPGKHLDCKARSYGTWIDKLRQAYKIWQGVGMSIQGVRTCGDYMFSGHTVTLTLLNFFITEYTPEKFYFVHTLSWVLNLFGVFFILAGHEHYSIDVFIAFYISTRLFLYYHTLANNRALYQGDRHRTRIWFPLFYFFESNVNGIVPNQFELPFRNLFSKIKQFLHCYSMNDFLKYGNDKSKLNPNELCNGIKDSKGCKRKKRN